MNPKTKSFLMIMVVVFALMLIFIQREKEAKDMKNSDSIQNVKLPHPAKKGDMSLEEAISKRRSYRFYKEKALSQEQLSQILWAAQGVTEQSRKSRSVPSAGALYPLEIYVVSEEGLYRYLSNSHSLEKLSGENLKVSLCDAAGAQECIAAAPADIVIVAAYERTTGKYGERGIRYVHMEAGHAAENIQLQAVVLGLGSVTIGAFSDEDVAKVLSLAPEYIPLYIIPIGYTK